MKIDEFLDNPDLQEQSDANTSSKPAQPTSVDAAKQSQAPRQKPEMISSSSGDSAETKLKSLLSSFESAVRANDVDRAMMFYAELKHMGHMLIELSQDDREQVYQRIVASDKKLGHLLETVENGATQALKDLEGQYHSMAGKPYAEGKLIYQAMNQRLATFPKMAEEKKEQATITVLHAYIALLNTKQKEDRQNVTGVHKKIIDIIMHAKEHIHHNRFADAKQLYEKALQTYNSLPSGYLSEKSHLYRTIISLFNEISYTEKVYALKAMIDSENSRSSFQQSAVQSVPAPNAANVSSGSSAVGSISAESKQLQQATELIKQRKYAEAKQLVEAIVKRNPQDKQAQSLLAIVDKAHAGYHKQSAPQSKAPQPSSAKVTTSDKKQVSLGSLKQKYSHYAKHIGKHK